MEESRSAFKILTGKPAGKKPLGRPRRRWEGNIRMDLKVIGINARIWYSIECTQENGTGHRTVWKVDKWPDAERQQVKAMKNKNKNKYL